MSRPHLLKISIKQLPSNHLQPDKNLPIGFARIARIEPEGKKKACPATRPGKTIAATAS